MTLGDALMQLGRRWRLWERIRSRHRAIRSHNRQLRGKLSEATRKADDYRTAWTEAEQSAADARDELQATRAALDAAEGRLEVLRSQIELFAAWEARERMRLEAETAMLAARKVRAATEQLGPETPQ